MDFISYENRGNKEKINLINLFVKVGEKINGYYMISNKDLTPKSNTDNTDILN